MLLANFEEGGDVSYFNSLTDRQGWIFFLRQIARPKRERFHVLMRDLSAKIRADFFISGEGFEPRVERHEHAGHVAKRGGKVAWSI